MKKNKLKMSGKTHDFYMSELENRIGEIGLHLEAIELILKEPMWLAHDSCRRTSMCDMIILMQNKISYPLELKGSRKQRSKAIDQMYHGLMFIDNYFPTYHSCSGLFVVYTRAKYITETIVLR